MQTFEHAGLEAVNMLMGPVSEAIFSLWLGLLSHISALIRTAILVYRMKLVSGLFLVLDSKISCLFPWSSSLAHCVLGYEDASLPETSRG